MKDFKGFTYLIACLISGLLLSAGSQVLQAQSSNSASDDRARFQIQGPKDERITIPFKMVNNLVIIPLRINDSDTLKFILDTGVGTTLITGLADQAEMTIHDTEEIRLTGLGEGEPLEAFHSRGNNLYLNRLTGKNLELVILKKDIFHLSSFMGTFVHGLIGYDLFANFVVEINYQRKLIHLYDPEAFKSKFEHLPRHRLWNKYSLQIENRKPYIDVWYRHAPNAESVPLKLLIDSGSSNAFSFYKMTDNKIRVPEKTINTLIGIGLSGYVNGKMGRVQEVTLGDYTFNKPVIAFPDSVAIHRALVLSDRNGSLGGEVLKRFKAIFHYQDSSLFLRANPDLRKDFNYNMSGIEISTPIPNLPIFVISKVREGSPAAEAGIEPEDIITQIDGEASGHYTLQQVLDYLEDKKGDYITLKIQRDSKEERYRFKLSDDLKVDEE